MLVNDPLRSRAYHRRMGQPKHDWYLREWCAALQKTQANIVRDLEWNKARVSFLWNGKQPYTRDILNDLADYLRLQPYELLMHPEDAMAIRRLRGAASAIAAVTFKDGLPTEAPRTGTHG